MLVPIEGAADESGTLETWAGRSACEITGQTPTIAAHGGLDLAGEIGGGLGQPVRSAINIGPAQETAARGWGLIYRPADERGTISRGGVELSGELPWRVARQTVQIAALSLSGARASRAAIELGHPITDRPTRSAFTLRSQIERATRNGADLRRLSEVTTRDVLTLAQTVNTTSRRNISIGGLRAVTGRGTVEILGGEGLDILVDVIPEELGTGPGPAGFYWTEEITCRLLVDGDEVDITAFDYSMPKDSLGAALNCTLAQPDLVQVPANAAITFQLGFTRGGVTRWVSLVQNGRIAGRDYTVAWRSSGNAGGPADTVQVSSVDILADKFGLAPRRPVSMYDPQRVKQSDVEVRPSDALQAEDGTPILPIYEPVAGLTSRQVLERAYTSRPGFTMITAGSYGTDPSATVRLESAINDSRHVGVGLGFAGIVTNIPTYAVRRADFTVEGGWHEGTGPVVGPFGPAYFVIGNRLYIMNTDAQLPAGLTVRRLPMDDYVRLQLLTPVRDLQNAVIVTYAMDPEELAQSESLYADSRVEQVTTESGVFGTMGYSKQESYVRFRVMKRLDDHSVVAEFPESTEVRTYGTETVAQLDGDGKVIGWLAGALKLLHRETQQDTYDGLLKTGHTKVVEAHVGERLIGGWASELRPVLNEKCTIVWKQDPNNLDQMIQVRNTTQISGLVYQAKETREVGGQKINMLYPALVADAGGIITGAGKFLEDMAIETITEYLRPLGGSQVDVQVVVQNHLTGSIKRGVTQPRTGNRSTSVYTAKQRSVLLRDLDSEALIGQRKPLGFNAGELPRTLALPLGHRVLYRLMNPAHQSNMELPGVDMALQKGAIIKGQLRVGGDTPPCVVTGFNISGNNLGQQGHRIFMRCEGVETSII